MSCLDRDKLSEILPVHSIFGPDLRELKKFVRVGLSSKVTLRPKVSVPKQGSVRRAPLRAAATPSPRLTKLEKAIRKKLRQLRAEGIDRADLGDRLQFKTLEAEFEYNFGKPGKAAEDLEILVVELDLTKRLDECSRDPHLRFQDPTDPQLLKRKIWALMGVSLYRYLLLDKVDKALETLLAIEKLIENELRFAITGHPPYGSLARVHHFLAQCHRSAGDFDAAERHLFEAQRNADKRLQREIDEAAKLPPAAQIARCQYEYQFGIICTARVLGSLGRIAILQGCLHRSRQHLHAAHTLLMPSGQEPLKIVVGTYMNISDRRLSSPGSTDWKCALKNLEGFWEEFRKQDDLDGQRRCLRELTQAHLDHAESLPAIERADSLNIADRWISELSSLEISRSAVNPPRPEQDRSHILRVWSNLLQAKPNIPVAQQYLAVAQSHLKTAPKSPAVGHYRDLVGADTFEIRMAEGFLLQVQAKEGPQKGKTAPVAFFTKLLQDARSQNHKVIEAECILRLAISEIHANRTNAAQNHLQLWQNKLAPLVENISLRLLFQSALKGIKHPVYRFPLKDLDFYKEIYKVERYLCQWALAQTDKQVDAEKLLNLCEKGITQIKRKLKEHHVYF